MRQKTTLLFHRCLRWLLSISLFAAGICLMVQCLHIYHSGDHPFTPQSVADAFAPISIPVFLCLVLIVLSFGLELLLPCPVPKAKPEKNYDLILDRLAATVDLTRCGEPLHRQVTAQRSRRKLRRYLGIALLVLGSLPFLIYCLDKTHFDMQEITGCMKNATIWLAICMAIPFLYYVYAIYANRRSVQREIALLKSAPADARIPAPAPVVRKADARQLLRWSVLVIGIGLLVYGAALGGATDVLTKAVNICTECVGLG